MTKDLKHEAPKRKQLWESYAWAKMGLMGMVVGFLVTVLFTPSWFAWIGASWFATSTIVTFYNLTDLNGDMARHQATESSP